MKNRILVGMLAASATLVSLPGEARVNVDIDIAPPPPVVEVVPPPRVGFVWAPGYWAWRDHRHVWVTGQWVHARAGYRWESPQWVEVHGRWHYVDGHWVR